MNRFCAALALFCSLPVFAATNSDRYRSLEADSPSRLQFIRGQDALLEKKVAADANYRPIKNWLRQLYGPETILKTVPLDSTHTLKLVDRGVGQPTELVYAGPAGEEVLVSNSQFQPNNIYNLNDFTLSPDGQHIALTADYDGSIDAMQALVYDLPHRRLLPIYLGFAEKPLAWSSPTTLLYPVLNADYSQTIKEFDINTQKTKELGSGWIADEKFHSVLYYSDALILQDRNDQAQVLLDDSVDPKFIVAADAQSTYLWCNGKNLFGEIRRFPHSSAKTTGQVVVPESDLPIRAVRFAGDHLFLMVRRGANRWLRVFALGGGPKLAEISLPDYAALGTKVEWRKPGAILRIWLTSATSPELPFDYDLASGKWLQDPRFALNNNSGVSYQTEVITTKSEDGATVPIRLTYRADLPRDGQRPTLFTSYGGFTESGYLDPHFDKAILEFMKRGGISAAAALRGGDEFGPDWHTLGTFAQKVNTFADLAAAARELVRIGWTKPSLITSTGTSNGGLTVAGAALLNPDLFGLVIPVSGDVDLLGKDRMDPQFFGWSYEYGDADDPTAVPYLTSESPLENAGHQGHSVFLIIEGINDTRVNMAHSLKLTQALLAQGGHPENVHLAAFKNAGHWLGSVTYQSLIGLRAAALQWTLVFEQAGWSW